jgi:5-methylcytosine-specific restriction endonuclease McrA
VPTRKLTAKELEKARVLVERVRVSLEGLSAGEAELLFAYRRKIAKQLMYDERSSPAKRKSLKRRKLISQDGKCAPCGAPLPPAGLGSVLDRLNAMDGYADANTRLLCRDCDLKTQRERAFTG